MADKSTPKPNPKSSLTVTIYSPYQNPNSVNKKELLQEGLKIILHAMQPYVLAGGDAYEFGRDKLASFLDTTTDHLKELLKAEVIYSDEETQLENFKLIFRCEKANPITVQDCINRIKKISHSQISVPVEITIEIKNGVYQFEDIESALTVLNQHLSNSTNHTHQKATETGRERIV